MVQTDYSSTIEFLYKLKSSKGIEFGPDRIKRIKKILALLGDPQKSFKVIHITGTNGKGSTSAMISSILEAAGFRVGLYTSPHLIEFRERILVNKNKISEADVVRIFEKIKPFISNETFFEVVTLIALKYFQEKKVDFAVLEVGMGGRLDATNVVNPLVSVITNVSLEHTEFLGNTIDKIAREKAGIIKEKSVLVTAAKEKKIINLFTEICKKKNTKIFRVGKDVKFKRLKYDLHSQEFMYFGIQNNKEKQDKKQQDKKHNNNNKKNKKQAPIFKIPFTGKHQIKNALCAICAVETLNFYGIKIPENKIKKGLIDTVWQGRIEVVMEDPLLILDVGHNPACMEVLRDTLTEIKKISKYKNLILIIGILAYKDIKAMLEIISPITKEIVLTKPKTDLASETEVMENILKKIRYKGEITIKKEIPEALNYALSKASKDDAICITGSFFTSGEALNQLNSMKSMKSKLLKHNSFIN